MNWISNIKESPHYEKLRASVQYQYDRRQFFIVGGIILLCLLMLTPLLVLEAQSPYEDASNTLFVVFWCVVMACVALFFLYRWLEIFMYMDSYHFFRAKLERPYLRHRGGAGFTVEFTDRQGKRREMQTSPMFSSQWEPILEEYSNKEVLLAYNEKTDRLIVIRKVNG